MARRESSRRAVRSSCTARSAAGKIRSRHAFARLDAWLRAHDPSLGVRELEALEELATRHGFSPLERSTRMPEEGDSPRVGDGRDAAPDVRRAARQSKLTPRTSKRMLARLDSTPLQRRSRDEARALALVSLLLPTLASARDLSVGTFQVGGDTSLGFTMSSTDYGAIDVDTNTFDVGVWACTTSSRTSASARSSTT